MFSESLSFRLCEKEEGKFVGLFRFLFFLLSLHKNSHSCIYFLKNKLTCAVIRCNSTNTNYYWLFFLRFLLVRYWDNTEIDTFGTTTTFFGYFSLSSKPLLVLCVSLLNIRYISSICRAIKDQNIQMYVYK